MAVPLVQLVCDVLSRQQRHLLRVGHMVRAEHGGKAGAGVEVGGHGCASSSAAMARSSRRMRWHSIAMGR